MRFIAGRLLDIKNQNVEMQFEHTRLKSITTKGEEIKGIRINASMQLLSYKKVGILLVVKKR